MIRTCFVLLLALIVVGFFQPLSSFSEESNYEIVFWETIKDSKDPNLFQMYLDKYPDGAFAGIAEVLKQKYSTAATETKTLTPAPKKDKPKPEPKPKVKAVSKKSYNTLAIFPFKFYDDADNMKAILLNDLTRIVDRYRCLEFSYSYYDLDAKYRVKDLSSRNVISSQKLNARNLWRGNTPNSDTISAIGKELGVDTIVTGSLRISNPWSDAYNLGYIRIFIVDVATGTISKAKNHDTISDARDVLPSVVQEAVESYSAKFCK